MSNHRYVRSGQALLMALVAVATLAACDPFPPPSPTPTPVRTATPFVPRALTFDGLAYGPYHAGQNPLYGGAPSAEEVRADMPTLAALTHSIRIYSATGPAAAILDAAQHASLSVNLGIWLNADSAANDRELAAGTQLAASPAVRAVSVGNEVLLRRDLSEAALDAKLKQVRAAIPASVQVTMADSYGTWLAHPALANDVDFLTVHIYPFWEGKPIDEALAFIDAKYRQVQAAFPGKEIVIGETGWPCAGLAVGAAVPSPANQVRYAAEFTAWAQQRQVRYYYFEAFDEGWKEAPSGGEAAVGAHWGLFQEDGSRKPAFQGFLPTAAPDTLRVRSDRDIYVGSALAQGFEAGIDTSQQRRDWLSDEHGVLRLAYPAGQQWGVMFITWGPPSSSLNLRDFIDLSGATELSVAMRTDATGRCVLVGIKDVQQADDGSETKVPVCLTTDWSTITLPLSRFLTPGAQPYLAELYVVFEIVFDGPAAMTVELRDLRYHPAGLYCAQTSASAPVAGGVSPSGGDPTGAILPPALPPGSAHKLAGHITEFSIPTRQSQPDRITNGPDGALWFVEQTSKRIGRITTTGQLSVFSLPTEFPNPDDITAGSDGALWFTASAADTTTASRAAIGRMTTSGQVRAFAVTPVSPHASPAPVRITSAPDGALWFSDMNSPTIRRITTDGTVSQCQIDSMPGGFNSITSGPDSALWFTSSVGVSVWRMTTSGRFALIPLQVNPFETVDGITAGSDGNLWFIMDRSNQIARMTPAGIVTRFAVPTPLAGLGTIVAGPDGALWFTERDGNKIGRITTGGQITEYQVPTAGAHPSSVAAGPDGAIWFTESDGNKIGRIT